MRHGRMRLQKHEKLMFPELRSAMRRHRVISQISLEGLTPPEMQARIQRVLTVGLKTAFAKRG